MQALIAVSVFSALSVWIAPFGLLVGGIIALVTLRVSMTDGFKALACAALVNVILTLVVTGNYWPSMLAIMEYMLPVWVMSVILRKTNSLAVALQYAMVLAGLGLIGFYLMIPDPSGWWLALFNQYISPVLEASGVDYQPDMIAKMMDMITMLLAVFAVILWFSVLTIGRWWQSELYHPGQFKIDFYQLRLPKSTAYVAIVLAILGLVLGENNGLISDLTAVVIVGLMFQGIAIAHHTVNIKKLHTAWLVGLYALLFIFPQTMLILATIGLVDTWMDFRNRWQKEEL
ncbi:MAG: YybS family protein [Thiomicrorhabdus sp.]|nr:YybS family protein [Thiomicrorhabdus sp.]